MVENRVEGAAEAGQLWKGRGQREYRRMEPDWCPEGTELSKQMGMNITS